MNLLAACLIIMVWILAGCGGSTPTPQLPPVIIITPTPENVFGTLVAETPPPAQTLTSSPTNTPELPLESSKRVAFFAPSEAGKMTIYVINDNGSSPANLADVSEFFPVWPQFAWSPDGKQIAFITTIKTSGTFPSSDVWKMNANGSERVKLPAPLGGHAESITWSPDGLRIAFDVNNTLDEARIIYLTNIDGSGLTVLPCRTESCFSLSWSPDGKRVAFTASPDGPRSDIHVMNTDGTEEVNLTNNLADSMDAAWSPDGQKIAFSSSHDDLLSWEIYMMNADGSGQTQLTQLALPKPAYIVWSPDGTRIAFFPAGGLASPVYVMDIDGSDLIELTDSGGFPAWSPDGKQIAYMYVKNRKSDIFIKNADGSGESQLTNTGNNIYPHWLP
jgi:Tol biopolymer transport system component